MKKVAIIQEWFTTFAGSEKVLAQLLQVFPQAELFSLIDFLPAADRARLDGRSIRTSFLQGMPFVRQNYRLYLPLMPLAIEQLNLSGYDLVISNCHAVSKGVLTGPEQLHLSYIHTPIRYAWDMQEEYLATAGLKGLRGWLARLVLHYIRIWDMAAAARPDRLVANSKFIASRIQKTYRRECEVIYPPVDTDYFCMGGERDDFYLTSSRLVPYKRIDLIAQAFQDMPDRKLVIIGDGSEAAKIKQFCGPNVTWLGYQPDEVLRDHMQRCRAFIFAAREDFGIMPLEAQACGAPVIAYREGGVGETVRGLESAQPTGILFERQSAGAIREAVEGFEQNPDRFKPDVCRQNAERFSNQRFRREFYDFVLQSWNNFEAGE